MDDLQVLYEFHREGEANEEELSKAYIATDGAIKALELRRMLGKEEDALGAILKINSGAGGTESMDWAMMLLRMYQHWAERKGYQFKVADLQEGEEAGIKSATVEIVGDTAYATLRGRMGCTGWYGFRPLTATPVGTPHSPRCSYRPPLMITSR